MSKKVRILLNSPLAVHLTKDQRIDLHAGLQEVDQAVAEHWFVKAHAQEITEDTVQMDAKQKELEGALLELDEVKTQLEQANLLIIQHVDELKAKDTVIFGLQKQLDEVKTTPKVSSSAKEK